MDNRDKSDESLMEEAKAGSRAALDVLIRRFASRLLTFLVRLTGGIHAAEDVFQETFGAVWEKRFTYKIGRAFKPWLYTIAVNQHRKRGRRMELPIVRGVSEEQWGETHVESPEDRERMVNAERALAKLGPWQRDVVMLNLYGGMSYAQIGECLGCGESTARGFMYQGLIVLRRELGAVSDKEAKQS